MTDDLPRGIRNNNPGNIKDLGVPWQGLVGHDAAGFCIFDTPEHGLRALAMNLVSAQTKHGCLTLRQIICRHSETDQQVYVANAVKRTGILPGAKINLAELPATFVLLMQAIIAQENGAQYANYYPPKTILAAVDAVLYV
jgi:hypothetical protein